MTSPRHLQIAGGRCTSASTAISGGGPGPPAPDGPGLPRFVMLVMLVTGKAPAPVLPDGEASRAHLTLNATRNPGLKNFGNAMPCLMR